MRESLAGLAWIERLVGDEPQWLVLWNEKWQRYSLVGGHLEPNESFRDSVLREVEEELRLTRDQDFHVSEHLLVKLEYEALSESAKEQTRYRHEIFSVTLQPDAQDRITSQPGVRWVTADEIEHRTTSDGQPIGEQVERAWRDIPKRSAIINASTRRQPDEFDLFVSYARDDNGNGWITRFVEGLVAEHGTFSGGRELTCFFDKQDIRGGDDWQHRLHDGLAKSRLFLAFVSPRYFASEWCRKEWKAWIDVSIAKHILSEGATPIYIVEVPGLVGKSELGEHEVARKIADLCDVPTPHDDFITATSPIIKQLRRRQFNAVQPFFQQGLDALRREDLRSVLNELAHDLDQRAQQVRQAADSESNVPPYNKQFTGRLDELMELRKRLTDDQAGVICGIFGLGGIGKTELAFTYAHAFASVYRGGRFLIPCEGKSSLRDAVLVLGDRFREQVSDEERKTAETYFAAISACLRERLNRLGSILLVLDNVTDTSIVSRQETDLLTALGPKLHLLATTRLLPPSEGSWLRLGELPEADALDLLEKHRPFRSPHAPREESRTTNDAEPKNTVGEKNARGQQTVDGAPGLPHVEREGYFGERTAALRIVKRLGGFTLAVELVAAWLATHPETSYAQFAEGLGLEDLEAIADSDDVELRRHNHQRRLSAVLGPVLDELRPAERRALEYAACLPPDLIPLPWLQTLVTQDFPELSQRSRLSDPWSDLCRRLVRLALFTRVEEESTDQRLVRVHRLVQYLVRRDLDESTVTKRQQALQTLIEERDRVLEQTTRWQDARWELEPLDALADLWTETHLARASWLLNQVGLRWHALAEWTRAEPVLRRALVIDEQTFGVNHPAVAVRLNNLGALFQRTNRLSETEPLIRRALMINEQSYGTDDPLVATCLRNLAVLLKKTNRLAEAEPLFRRALAVDAQSVGTEHPNYATDCRELAGLLKDTNRLGEAESLLRHALATDMLHFGSEHSSVERDFSDLALVLMDTNRETEAESLMRHVITMSEKRLGAEHPDVAAAFNNLAYLLKATKRYAEAEPLMRRALAIDEQFHGPEHPIVANGLSNLAMLLKATNRLEEAEPLIRRALAIVECSLGIEHPNVATCLNNLAALLWAMNRLAEAEPLMRRMVGILLKFTQATGYSHPHLQGALGNYAGLLQAMGMSDAEVHERLNELLGEYGMSLD